MFQLITAQQKLGVDNGPIHLVEAGLTDQLTELGWNVKFDGHHQFEDLYVTDDPPIGKLRNPRFVSRVTESVAKAVGAHAANGELPVTLGGDHSLVSLPFPIFVQSCLYIGLGYGDNLGNAQVDTFTLLHTTF